MFLVVLLAFVAAGCRTARPELKPTDLKEEHLVEPPEGKYQTAEYPKQAFDKALDPGKAAMEAKSPGAVPGRGSGFMPTGGGGGFR